MGRLKTELYLGADLIVLQSEDSITGSQTSLQFAFIEGFGEIVIGARLETPDQILFRVFSGREKYVLVGSLVTLSNLAAQLQAIDRRHHPIENQQLRRGLLLKNVPGSCAVFRNRNQVPPVLQPALQYPAEHRVVFRNQHPVAGTTRAKKLSETSIHPAGRRHSLDPGGPATPSTLGWARVVLRIEARSSERADANVA